VLGLRGRVFLLICNADRSARSGSSSARMTTSQSRSARVRSSLALQRRPKVAYLAVCDHGILLSPALARRRTRDPREQALRAQRVPDHPKPFRGVDGSAAASILDTSNAGRYHGVMIRSFRDLETERVFDRRGSTRFPPDISRTALKKLLMLDAAESLSDLRVPPGNRLERLSGDQKELHSIRINDQWRICFRWKDGDALDVEVVDCH